MVYKYYCVNCGNQNEGNEICFDLSELVGVRSDSDGSKPDRLAMITSGTLKGNANMCGAQLVHGELCKIRISLKIYLGVLGLNNKGKNGIGVKEMRGYFYNELDEALEQVYTSNENREAAAQNIGAMATAIRNQFEYAGPLDEPEALDDTDFYYATIYVKPIFFENGDSKEIYTIEYARSELDPNTVPLRAEGQPIRGYCPKCGKAIISNAGIYPHVLVGLLGTQSAGKTTMILALLDEIFNNYDKCGIMLENTILADECYANVDRDRTLFENGWAPMKTNMDGANAFNASMLLESSITGQKKIVTFADIAGERCYNVKTDTVDLDALRSFPLINSCDVYLLCSCIDRTQYGNGNDQLSRRKHAILNIAKSIYSHLRDPKKVPPLCIVLTKADVTPRNSFSGGADNPFNAITPKYEHLYEYMTQFSNLKNTFATVDGEDIKEPLAWCCKTYEQMEKKTYLSMMSCSALGRSAVPYEGNMEKLKENEEGRFKPIGVTPLLKWIMQNIGLCPINNNLTGGRDYFLRRVPSYEEYYRRMNTSNDGQEYYTIADAVPRSKAIPSIFLNPTPLDNEIYATTKPAPPPKKKKGGFLGIFEVEEVQERPSVDEVIKKADRLLMD